MIIKKITAMLVLSTAVYASAQVSPTADEEKNMKSLSAVPDSGWISGGTFTLNSAATYLNQWAAGGNNSVNITGLLNYSLNYRKGKNAWDNTFDLAYGIQLLGFDERAIKTDDKIDFTSKYGRQASQKWFYAGLVNFKTQFAPGYGVGANGIPLFDQYKISDLMAPGFLLASLGMDYKPNNDLTVFISPITYRGIFVLDDILAAQGAFGVEKGELGLDENGNLTVVQSGASSRTEMGAYLRAQYAKEVMKNVTLSSRLELFSNYLDKPGNIDISFQNLITMKANKFLTTTLFFHWLYDDNTVLFRDFDKDTNTPTNPGPGLQTKFVLGVGITVPLK